MPAIDRCCSYFPSTSYILYLRPSLSCFLVVLAVSDPLLLSVAALSTRAHSPRVYLIGGISGLSGEQGTWNPPAPLPQPITQEKGSRWNTNTAELCSSFLSLLSRILSVSSSTGMMDLMQFDCRVPRPSSENPDFYFCCIFSSLCMQIFCHRLSGCEWRLSVFYCNGDIFLKNLAEMLKNLKIFFGKNDKNSKSIWSINTLIQKKRYQPSETFLISFCELPTVSPPLHPHLSFTLCTASP